MRKSKPFGTGRALLFVLLSGLFNPGGLLVLWLISRNEFFTLRGLGVILQIYTLPCLGASLVALFLLNRGSRPWDAALGGLFWASLAFLPAFGAVLGAIAWLNGEVSSGIRWSALPMAAAGILIYAITVGLPAAAVSRFYMRLLLSPAKT